MQHKAPYFVKWWIFTELEGRWLLVSTVHLIVKSIGVKEELGTSWFEKGLVNRSRGVEDSKKMDSLTLLSKATKTWVTDYLEGIIKRVKIF